MNLINKNINFINYYIIIMYISTNINNNGIRDAFSPTRIWRIVEVVRWDNGQCA